MKTSVKISKKRKSEKSKNTKQIKPVSYGRVSARKDLPQRTQKDNKTSGGKVLVVAGSPGMWGAQQLAAEAASRCGTGYVYCFQRASQKNSIAPDFLTITPAQLKKIAFSSVVLGPGFRQPQKISQLLRYWIKTKQQNVVLDAEALNWLATHSFPLLPSSWVLTPHEGEMARLLKISSQNVRNNREQAVLQAQKKYGGVVLLKGANSLVYDGKKMFRIQSGNAALAKAGSGDVLAGMIAAFLAQNQKSSTAACVCLAAYVHGFIADNWLRQKRDVLSLRPVDLIKALPEVIVKIRKSKTKKTK